MGVEEIYPDFMTKKTDDFMIRGGKFYAILNPENEMWMTDEYYVQIFVDQALKAFAQKEIENDPTLKEKHLFALLPASGTKRGRNTAIM